MTTSDSHMSPADADIEARVTALEEETARLSLAVAALEERVEVLEGTPPVEPPVEPPIDPPPVDPPPVTETGLLTIALHLPDGTRTFDEANAVDVGDYVGEFVHQRCLMVRQGPWVVFFRPDADQSRLEVVVEYGGWDFSVSPAVPLVTPAHAPAYTAIIWMGAETLATINVPAHDWLTRWRWQSAPRPVVRSASDLVEMKATLPLSEEALINDPPSRVVANAVWAGPMDTAGLTIYMPTTGDRQEIGPLTDLQASYLLRGNPEALTGLLAQAEAVGSMPFWVRDPATECLLDIYEYPNNATDSSADTAHYPRLNPLPAPAGGFVLDNPHFPSVAFVPWMLTDDPYFLEGCQAMAIYGPMETNYYVINEKLPGLACLSQKRAFAWSLRNAFQMALFAPPQPPQWLLPRALFQEMVEDSRTYCGRGMASEIKASRIFHMIPPQNGSIATWQEGYLLSVLGWVRWTGVFPEWNTAIDWMAQVLLNNTADPAEGGWDRRWPCGYYIFTNRARKAAVDLSIVAPGTNIVYTATIPEPYHDETPESLGELWQLYRDRMALEGKPITMGDEDRIYQNPIDNPLAAGSSLNYMEIVCGTLGALALGGVPGAADHHAWMRAHLQEVFDAYGGNVKTSFRYAYLG